MLESAANTAEAVMVEENQRLTHKIGDVLSLRAEFAPHMTSAQLNELLTQPFSQVLAGKLEVSTHNPMEAYVLVEKPHAIEKVLVFGRAAMNRGVHEDYVAVKMLPKTQWSAK
ncbi:hypothetical protein PsorP6_010295 [Peronosclerospora sorghi]|uniref:Uncharacterized protein n=1 Tax=Peronosclerospora sorghi TaxID=230839 RepID=A0ACC0VXW4_9STRA|nr:hypothetical protein PsorP6_010295 [Peronosclerospora sorghi]